MKNHCISATVSPILTIYTPYDVFPGNGVPFGGRVDTAPYLADQIKAKPKLWGHEFSNRRFQAKYSNFCKIKTTAAITNNIL